MLRVEREISCDVTRIVERPSERSARFPNDSPVNLGFDLEQIATEMIFAGSNSLNSAS